jgi:hypothetical protein
MKKKFNGKIFIIGQNKTATSSMRKILIDLGFRSPKTQEQELAIVEPIRTGQFEVVRDFVKNYDAFKDIPFSSEHFYVVFDVLFPDSKFILTIRDEGEWFRSLVSFQKKVFNFRYIYQANEAFFKDNDIYLQKNYLYKNFKRIILGIDYTRLGEADAIYYDWSKVYKRDFRINQYLNRNEQIARYFNDRPGSLLIIDLAKELDTKKIVDFLGLPESCVKSIPYINKTAR